MCLELIFVLLAVTPKPAVSKTTAEQVVHEAFFKKETHKMKRSKYPVLFYLVGLNDQVSYM